MSLPAPDLLGLPPQFTAWRDGQVDAVLRAIDAPERFTALVLPTGFGKSLVYTAIAHLTGKRTTILTGTKALQRQLRADFASLDGVAIVQGQRAYLCKALEPGGEHYVQFADGGPRRETYVDHGPCHLGVDCSLKASGCGYFDALRAAVPARITIANYAWWFAQHTTPVLPLPRPELLVLDEAHAAPDALADALGATISADLCASVLRERLPRPDTHDAAQWITWAKQRAARLATMLEGAQPRTRQAIVQVRRAQTLHYALKRIAAIPASQLLVSEDLDGLRFDVVWAATFSESWLFRGVPRVLLTSATLTRKTADLLGIMEKDLAVYESGEGFPLARRPVYLAPARKPPFGQALQIDHRLTPEQEAIWIAHIDAILDGRLDRNGIIHTISYRRRDLIIARSRHRERMITHGRHDTAAQIAKFKAAAPGTAILVSPAITTGYDFPFAECEFQIVCKIPFPDGRDPVTKARSIVDPRYPAHLAMQELVQAIGRGMRAPADQCESFIVDAHALWFCSKHADLAPRWFRRAIRRLEPGQVPAPPPPLPASISAA